MYFKLFITLIVCLLPICANAEWTTKDTELQAIYNTLQVYDWKQTLKMPSKKNYTENNIFLGKHPTTKNINIYMASSLITMNTISWLLDKDVWGVEDKNNYLSASRTIFQSIGIGVEGSAVLINFNNGF